MKQIKDNHAVNETVKIALSAKIRRENISHIKRVRIKNEDD